MYRVVFDNGKPYEETYKGVVELTEGLKKFYEQNKDSDYQFDFTVYDERGNDMSESQFVQEIVAEILEEHDGN